MDGVDANILVYANRADSPWHEKADRFALIQIDRWLESPTLVLPTVISAGSLNSEPAIPCSLRPR